MTKIRLADVLDVTMVRRRRWWTRTPVRLGMLALIVGAAVGVAGITAATRSDATTLGGTPPAAGAAQQDCPLDAAGELETLPADAVARAADAALKSVPDLYGPDTARGALATAASRATASVRGGEVATACGADVQERTVVVEFLFPAMLPSESLSQGVVWVSRIGGGYRVWHVAR